MPKFIVSQKATVLNEIAFKSLLPILGRLQNNEVLSNWENDEIDQLNQFVAAQQVGKIILTTQAEGMVANFTNNHSGVSASVSKSLVSTFLGECIAMYNNSALYPSTHELALRFYIGMDATDNYSFVIVPAYSPKQLVPGRMLHQDNLEKTAFAENSTAFFSLVADAGGASIERNLARARNRIINKDASGKELVFFSQGNLVKFFGGFKVPNDYTTMHLTLARETSAPNGHLCLVLNCLKGNTPQTSKVPGWPVAEGIYFDQGDLIPPPPPVAGDPIDDTSF